MKKARLRRLRRTDRCKDCRVNTLWIKEYYMVNDNVWISAGMHPQVPGMLCIGCLEHRLGRTLTRHDFNSYPINDDLNNDPRSARLVNRLRTFTTNDDV